MRLLSVLLTCVVFAASPAYSQAVVEHFVGPPVGPGFRDAIGTLARFSAPAGVSSDGESLYIVDTGNAMIRKMSLATMQVTTLAGRESGTFIRPGAVWTDGQTVYVTD